MKCINIFLLSIIICLVGIIFFFVCQHTYESEKSELSQKAKEAFVKALDHEHKNRNLDGTFSFNYDGRTLLVADIPDSVYMESSEAGKKWYKLDPEKHLMSITSNMNVRSLHSFIFQKDPMDADSLSEIWKEYLEKSSKAVELALFINIMDNDGKVKSICSAKSEWCTASDRMFIIYIGYACEIEVIGFINYSIFSILGWWIFVYLLFYIFSILAVYIIVSNILNKIRSLPCIKIKEVHIPVFVKESDVSHVYSYALRDNFIFYAEQRTIEVDGKKKKMPLQACMLLELFLNSTDYKVTYDEIMNKLWPDGSGHIRRVHKAVA